MKKIIKFVFGSFSTLAFGFFSTNLFAQVLLPAFDNQGIQRWEKKEFSGETTYRLTTDEKRSVLQAISNNAASGLLMKQRVDLAKTPYINWSWKVTQKLPPLAENTKPGDDYAARIYLIMEKGFLSLNSIAINYVWSSTNSKGNIWNNPFAGSKVKMLAVRDNSDSENTWYKEKRNVYQDMIRYFGDKGSASANLKAYQYIDVVAIMTDTDNSKLSAESLYGNISFSSN